MPASTILLIDTDPAFSETITTILSNVGYMSRPSRTPMRRSPRSQTTSS